MSWTTEDELILEESLTSLEDNLSRDFRYIYVNKDFFGCKELGE